MPIAHSALQDQLDKLRATLASNAPDFFAALDDNIAQLVRSEASARALAVGDRAPDFDLPAAAGGRVHAYYTDRVLARPEPLARIGAIASQHHKRMDGSGYHRGILAQMLSPAA